MVNVQMQSKYGAQVFYDRDVPQTQLNAMADRRWLDAISPSAIKALLDFVDEPTTSGVYTPRWTNTLTGSSSFGPVAGIGGLGRLATGATSGNGVNAQFGNAGFHPTLNSYLAYEVVYQTNEELNSSFFLGLANVSTTILSGPASDMIGFRKASGATDVDIVLRTGAAETVVSSVLQQDVDTSHTLNIFVDGPAGRVYFYVDFEETARMSTFSTTPFDVDLKVSAAFFTGEAVAHTMDIDQIRSIQLGRS